MSLKEVQKSMLGCLVYFDAFCRRHDLQYSLAFGTLIGAARHKGFIPWDDDIDVVMLRSEYDKMVALFAKEKTDSRYAFVNHENQENYYYTIGRITDRSTKIVYNDNKNDGTEGCFIDIYPIDNIYDNIYYRRFMYKLIRMALIVIALYKNSAEYKFFTRGKLNVNSCKGVVKWMVYAALRLFGKKAAFFPYDCVHYIVPGRTMYVCDMWNLVGIIPIKDEQNFDAGNGYVSVYKYKRAWFDRYIDIEFEGKRFMSVVAYDEFIRSRYGDYMTMPPEEKRVPHHEYEAYKIS